MGFIKLALSVIFTGLLMTGLAMAAQVGDVAQLQGLPMPLQIIGMIVFLSNVVTSVTPSTAKDPIVQGVLSVLKYTSMNIFKNTNADER